MATRFLLETKGISRVKGVTFHPVFPWICASTYIGVIHVWDYETNREIHRFRHPCCSKINDNKHYDQEEPLLEPNVTRGNDDGNGDIETGLPVRCVDFHPQDPLIISAGDDLNIKLWDCHIRQCLRTFSGHTDYIRTVRFHPKAHITSPHHLPWILSASDDRTLRIWNYLTRTCLCVVHDGHTDYIMSAQFHPTLDFILTASLDHTLRVWDTKHLVTTQTTNTQTSTPTTTTTTTPTATTAQTQHFNESHYSALTKSESSSLSTPIKLKFVLQGHQHGVNWAVFHPSLPFIASASDDCQVKIWKFTDDQAWEEKIQLTRHDLNVTCCMFANNTTMDTTSSSTPIIVSCSEDGRVCVWDGNDQTCIGAFRRNSRFWVLASHPTNNIMAAGHDSGFIIFKLEYGDNLQKSQRFKHDFEIPQDTTMISGHLLQQMLTRIYCQRPRNPFITILILITWTILFVSISAMPSPFYHYLGVFVVGFVSLLCRNYQTSRYETFFMSCWIFGGLGMFVCRPFGFFVAIVVLSFIADMFCRWRTARSSYFVDRGENNLRAMSERTCGDIIDKSKEIEMFPMQE